MLVSTIHSNNLIHFNYGINQYLFARCIFFPSCYRRAVFMYRRETVRHWNRNCIVQEIPYFCRTFPSKKRKLTSLFGPISSSLQHFISSDTVIHTCMAPAATNYPSLRNSLNGCQGHLPPAGPPKGCQTGFKRCSDAQCFIQLLA